jgi:hypothetical protein
MKEAISIPYNGIKWTEIPMYVENPEGEWWVLLADEGSYTLCPRAIVKVSKEYSFDDIFNEALDISWTVEVEDLYQAYGFDSEEIYKKSEKLRSENDYFDLMEGYYYQSNFTGTGIVELGDWKLYRYDHTSEKKNYNKKWSI